MTYRIGATAGVLIVLALSAPAAFCADTDVVARVGDVAITSAQLQKPLVEGYGLNVLFNIVQLELSKQAAKNVGVSVTPADIIEEHQQTIEKMFKDSNAKLQDQLDKAIEKNDTAKADGIRAQMKKDNDTAFEQFLANQHLARSEFDIAIENNAYLRKIATPMLDGKITEEKLKEAFAALYGETVEVRHIQCATLQQIQEARRRLNAGEDFAKVAREVSENKRTAPEGGVLPGFSRQVGGLPQNFKDAAFALKEGEVSEIVQADNAFHLIKLEKRVAPKAIKYEDVKESVRKDLFNRALQVTIVEIRQQIAQKAMQNLKIEDPILKQQFQARLDKQQNQIKDQDEIKKQIERDHAPAPTQAPGLDLAPAAAPPASPATQPAAP